MTSPEAPAKVPYVAQRVAALERAIPPTAPVAQRTELQSALWEAVQFSFRASSRSRRPGTVR